MIRPQALAGIADELPENVRVALWGAPASLLRVLNQISAATSRWVVFSPEMAETDLAERCVEMVG